MGSTTPASFTKEAGEQYKIEVDYHNNLPRGETITAVEGSGYNVTDSQSDDTILSSTTGEVRNNEIAILEVTGGTNGKEYLITFTSTLSGGGTLKDSVTMNVTALS